MRAPASFLPSWDEEYIEWAERKAEEAEQLYWEKEQEEAEIQAQIEAEIREREREEYEYEEMMSGRL